MFLLQATQRETKISVTTIAANKTMPTITPINMEKFMHDTPERGDDELVVGPLTIAPEGMIDR